jgi:protein-disulfide isomerase
MAKAKSKQTSAQSAAREAALLEAQRVKAAREAKERRTKTMMIAGGALIAVAMIVIVVLVLQTTARKDYSELAIRPLGSTKAGVIVIGQDSLPGGEAPTGDQVVVVRVYSDYMCPGCGSAERRLGDKLESLVASGDIKLELATIATLDSYSLGTRYSSRAADAASVVANYAPEYFLPFHRTLFLETVQPAQNSEGLTDDELRTIAETLGVPADVTARFGQDEFADWISYITEKARTQPVKTTPSIWLGTSDSDLTLIESPGSFNLDDAIARVRAGQDPNSAKS